MSQPNQSQRLDATVEDLLQSYNPNTFRRYWELYRRAVPLTEIRAFFVCVDPVTSYYNVAILGDDKLVDIEGDDTGGTGYVCFQSLTGIGAVVLREGQIEGFSRSQGASLVMLTRLVGETSVGPYWVARTTPEVDRLTRFATFLVDAIAHPQSFGVQQ